MGNFRRAEIRWTRVDLILVRARTWHISDEWTCQRTYVRSHVRPLIHTPPSTRMSRVRPLVRLHIRWVVRTSITTFMCTRHQMYALQDQYLLRDFQKMTAWWSNGTRQQGSQLHPTNASVVRLKCAYLSNYRCNGGIELKSNAFDFFSQCGNVLSTRNAIFFRRICGYHCRFFCWKCDGSRYDSLRTPSYLPRFWEFAFPTSRWRPSGCRNWPPFSKPATPA